jgi:hypothetical protein
MAKDGTDVMKPTTESRGARFEANTLLETRLVARNRGGSCVAKLLLT